MGVAPVHLGDRVSPERFYTIADVATLLGVTRPTVYRWLDRGRLIRVETLLGPKVPGYSIIDLIASQGRPLERSVNGTSA